MKKITDLMLKLNEIDFRSHDHYKKYKAKLKRGMRPTTKVSIGGKETTAGDADKVVAKKDKIQRGAPETNPKPLDKLAKMGMKKADKTPRTKDGSPDWDAIANDPSNVHAKGTPQAGEDDGYFGDEDHEDGSRGTGTTGTPKNSSTAPVAGKSLSSKVNKSLANFKGDYYEEEALEDLNQLFQDTGAYDKGELTYEDGMKAIQDLDNYQDGDGKHNDQDEAYDAKLEMQDQLTKLFDEPEGGWNKDNMGNVKADGSEHEYGELNFGQSHPQVRYSDDEGDEDYDDEDYDDEEQPAPKEKEKEYIPIPKLEKAVTSGEHTFTGLDSSYHAPELPKEFLDDVKKELEQTYKFDDYGASKLDKLYNHANADFAKAATKAKEAGKEVKPTSALDFAASLEKYLSWKGTPNDGVELRSKKESVKGKLGRIIKEEIVNVIKERYKLTEGTKVKIGDVLYLGKRKGKVTKVMSDMANVDFGKGDVYGITFSRIKGNKIEEGKLTEGAYYKQGQKVRYQIDRGSPKALKPSIGTISKIKKVGHGYQYTIQDGGPVPVWEAEILGPTSHNEGKLTESMIGIKTKANFKPNSLKGALERAGIKGFQMNRLSWSLTALKVDKKDFNNAKKIIDKLGLSVMMVKEGKITEGNIVTRNAWNRMSDDEKIDALQTAYEDPAEAMKHYDKKWEDLPSVATQNMYKEGKLKEIDMDRVFMKGRTKKRTTDESTKKKQYSKGDVIKVSIPKVATTKGKVVMIKQYQGAPVYLIKSPKGNLVAHQDHVIGLNEGIQHREDKKQQITELAKLNKMQRNAILGLLGLSILGFTFKAAAAPFFLLFAGYMHVNDFIEAQRYARKNPAKVAQMHQDHRGSQGYDVRLNSFM